jgi:hypothetical protein
VDATVAAPGGSFGEVDWLSLAERLATPLEVRLEVPAEEPPDPDRLRLVGPSRRIRRVLLVGPGESLPPTRMTDAVHATLRTQLPELQIAVGTRGPFAVVNRSWPKLAEFDGVCFGLHPQVHADDDLTIVENLEAIAPIVQTARRVGGKRRVHVAPVTLTPPVIGPTDGVQSTVSQTGPREATPFGAAWTLGSIAALAWASATSATYHGIGGPHGVVAALGGFGEPRRRGSSITGSSTGDLFVELGKLRTGRLIRLQAGREHPLAGIGLDTGGRRHLLMANLVDVPCRLAITGIGEATVAVWPGVAGAPSRRDPVVVELGGYGWARISEV